MGYRAIMEHWRWEQDWQIPISSAAVGEDGFWGDDHGEWEVTLETGVVGDVMEERISLRKVSRKW